LKLTVEKRASFAMEEDELFWSRVQRGGKDECWPWIGGCTDKNGYGQMRFRGKNELTHRIAYILTHGSIPDGLFACHHCDNPPCCNPHHLFEGTALDNMRDAISKGRLWWQKKQAEQDDQLSVIEIK
jgi:hypothetical protein